MVANLFDVSFYQQANPDLAAAGLTTAEQLTAHFFSFGHNENRPFSRFVDLGFYRASNTDLTEGVLPNNQALYDHLANNGVREGRKFSKFYSTGFYRQANTDLLQASLDNEQLFNHVQSNGLAEGRKFSEFFDLPYYTQQNSDLVNLGFNNTQIFDHARTFGIAEGRTFTPLLDLDFYLNINPDLNLGRDFLAAFDDLQISGIAQGRRFSPWINLDAYSTLNPDLERANLSNTSLYDHLASFGLNEGRRVSIAYDPNFYRQNNSDLQAVFNTNTDFLTHFQRFGFNEGRRGADAFNVTTYLDSNPDILAALDNRRALLHYETIGFREDRLATDAPIALSGLPGGGLTDALDLGVFSNRRAGSFTDSLNLTNQIDTYRFTLPFTATVNFNLQGLSSSVTAAIIFDGNGDGVAQPEEIALSSTGANNRTLNSALGTGTYFLRIQGSQDTNYTLSLTSLVASDINTATDPGNSDTTAFNVGVPSESVEFREFVGISDPDDYYRLEELLGIGIVVRNFSGELSGELIRDDNNNRILDNGDSRRLRTSTSQIQFGTLETDFGLHWFRVNPSATTNTLYTLEFI